VSLTPKQEEFVRGYLETGNASEAYRRAYNAANMKEETIWRKAKECMDNGKVTARLSELQAQSAEKHDITIERLTQMALDAYEAAQTPGRATGQMQTSAMVKAAEFLGKLHGLIVDKSEVSGKDGTPLIPVLNVTVGRAKP
jgi:phage terminase small subunit